MRDAGLRPSTCTMYHTPAASSIGPDARHSSLTAYRREAMRARAVAAASFAHAYSVPVASASAPVPVAAGSTAFLPSSNRASFRTPLASTPGALLSTAASRASPFVPVEDQSPLRGALRRSVRKPPRKVTALRTPVTAPRARSTPSRSDVGAAGAAAVVSDTVPSFLTPSARSASSFAPRTPFTPVSLDTAHTPSFLSRLTTRAAELTKHEKELQDRLRARLRSATGGSSSLSTGGAPTPRVATPTAGPDFRSKYSHLLDTQAPVRAMPVLWLCGCDWLWLWLWLWLCDSCGCVAVCSLLVPSPSSPCRPTT